MFHDVNALKVSRMFVLFALQQRVKVGLDVVKDGLIELPVELFRGASCAGVVGLVGQSHAFNGQLGHVVQGQAS